MLEATLGIRNWIVTVSSRKWGHFGNPKLGSSLFPSGNGAFEPPTITDEKEITCRYMQSYAHSSVITLSRNQGRKCILLGHNKLLVLMADVALDPAIVDQVGDNARCLVVVHILHFHQLQCRGEGLN